jgi:hypothetical protein
MIAPEAQIEELVRRRPFGNSFVSIAGRYIKDAWIRKKCVECAGTGGRKCSNCDGKGIVIAGGSFHFSEPCRRCIGTGKEECPGCEGAGVVSLAPTHDY